MEGIFFILIGAALFSQSWYVLGLYAEGRSMGMIVGGLGLASLIAITMTPMLLTVDGPRTGVLDQTTVMQWLIVVWAMYAVAVGAHGLWDFDDRAIGFYSGFLVVAMIIAFIYFAVGLQTGFGDGPWLVMSGAVLILAILAGLVFFYLAIPFNSLRLVTGWFLLIGGGAVAVFGMVIVTAAIEVTAKTP